MASEADTGQRNGGRRQAARRTEQLAVLSLAIVCGLLGFALHILWIPAIVLMALLWGYMASELGSSRRGGVVSDVVTAVVSEARELKSDVSERAPEAIESADERSDRGAEETSSDESEVPILAHDDPSATKKELYDEARDAGIEGRSNMTKDELQEALDE